MIRQRVLLTLTEENPGLLQSLGQEIARSGLDVQGSMLPGIDDERKALSTVLPAYVSELNRPDTAAWIIAGTAKSLADPKVRSLLSLAAAAAQSEHGLGFPIVISPSGGKMAEPLPQPLSWARMAPAAIGASTVAAIHMAKKQPAPEYRFSIVAIAGLGTWIETGPADGDWDGVITGLSALDGTGMDAGSFGVGQAGIVPQRCTLEHACRGMQAEFGGRKFTATGCANRLTPADSAFLQLSALPGAVFFGPFPKDDAPELWTVPLI